MARSEPLSRQPCSSRTRAKARMPEPPMPTRWALRARPIPETEAADSAFMVDSMPVHITPAIKIVNIKC